MRKKKVGFKEIAAAADVAISTVSHALNGTAPISDDVRNRVLNAAGQLGYLAKRREKAAITVLRSILLAVPSDTLPHNDFNLFSWTLLSTLMRECESRGIRLVPTEIDKPDTTGNKIVAEAKKQEVDGILLLSEDRPDILEDIAASNIPVVLINGEDHEMQVDSVTPGNRFAARYATNWLIEQGHRAIMHLTWDGRSTIRRRRDGFIDAFRSAKLPADSAFVHLAKGFLPDQGEAAVAEWIRRHDGLGGVTAIFCAADNLALGAMTALSKAGLKVPDDVSVVGFDGVTIGELTTPSLTTVSVPLEHMGTAALHLLEQRIIGAARVPPAHRLELGCELTIRNSARKLR